MVEVNWTIQALDDLDAIAEYLSNYSPSYTSRTVDQAFALVAGLKRFPKSGRIVPEIQNEVIRELILHKRYRIVYQIVSSQRIDILTIHPTARPLTEIPDS